jgi:glycosyltransferase involved in cell wall biosynthesis
MKQKILWCGEASYLKTGYAIYAKEVLGRLHATGLFDITEFALYASASDERFHNIQWRAIPNLPNENNPEEIQRFRSNSGNQFGAWKFEEVCLNTLPSVVCDIRDSWMTSYQALSPFRRHYNLCWMPTCDASPQNKEWLDIFAKADNIFTYQDWSKEILLKESAGKINVLDSASPAADPAFRPYKDTPSKELLGLSGKNIIGTIMRNQRRKLFPNLFRAFRQYINTYKDTDTILYCHTSYPDMGWELGDLLLEYGLTSRVLFTYICKLCNNVFPSFFNSAMCACPKCGKVAGEFCSVQRGPDNEQLASIINCFDIYTQYSNCLVPGQQIQTEDGWKNIEDIQINDTVLTHKNRFQKVVNTFEHENNNTVYQIDVHGDIDNIKLTAEHPVYIVDRTITKKDNKRGLRGVLGERIKRIKNFDIPHVFIEAKDLQPGDLLATPINLNVKDISKLDAVKVFDSIDLNGKRFIYNDDTIAILKGDFYKRYIIVDDTFCRFLGLFVADGSASYSKNNKNVRITCNSDENINIDFACKSMEQFSGKKPTLRWYKNRRAVSIEIYSVLYGKIFNDFGKLENKKLPDWVLTLPLEKQKQILYGMFMGDGCYYAKRNVSIYNTISPYLYEQIKIIALRLGLVFNVQKVIKKGNRKPQYRFEFRGDIKHGKFDKDRSSTRSLNYNGYYYKQIKDIKQIEYTGKVYNIEVEKDNSYVHKITALHNSEGLGMPQLEASACGVPIMSVDYSAMTDVVRKLGGTPIKVLTKEMEIETGCYRAIPDEHDLIQKWHEFFSLSESAKLEKRKQVRKAYEENYSWDITAQKWRDLILHINAEAHEKSWRSPPKFRQPQQYQEYPQINNAQYARWLILHVLCDPTFVNSYIESKIIKDLNYGVTKKGLPETRFSDMSQDYSKPNYEQYNREKAYQQMLALCNKYNNWEKTRWETVK